MTERKVTGKTVIKDMAVLFTDVGILIADVAKRAYAGIKNICNKDKKREETAARA